MLYVYKIQQVKCIVVCITEWICMPTLWFLLKVPYFSVLYSIEKYGTFKRNFVGALHCTTTTAASKNV